MEINKLVSCFSLWVIVEMISFLNTLISGRILKSRFQMKKIYCVHLLFLIRKSKAGNDILQKLYLGLSNNKLRQIIIRAIRKPTLKKQFEYVDKKIGCEAITLVHNYMLQPGKEAYTDLERVVSDKLRLMELTINELRKTLLNNKLRLVLDKTIIMLINLTLYFYIQNEYSLDIFIVVNTLGVIWFIILDYESVAVVLKFRERNLARDFRKQKKTLAPAYAIKTIFTTAAGLGLIINISMIAVNYLGLVI